MKKLYKLPIQGSVLLRDPLTGLENDPICVIPLHHLPNFPSRFDEIKQKEVRETYKYQCLDYNIDEEWCEIELEASEEFHNWLTNILPQLNNIKKVRKWKLDKSRLESKE